MIDLYFASHNPNKLLTIEKTLHYYGGEYKKLVRIKSIPKGLKEPVEGEKSLEENATIKATHYSKLIHHPVFSDDSGFYVDALGGMPGLMARRWSEETNETLWGKILRLVGDNHKRGCHATSAVCFYSSKNGIIQRVIRTATVEGEITTENHARPGHTAYDGIFIPKGAHKTVAQMNEKEAMDPRYSAKSKAFLEMLKEIV